MSTAIAPEPAISTCAIGAPAVAPHRVVHERGGVRALRREHAGQRRRPDERRGSRSSRRRPCARRAGTKTATISSRPDAPISASDGESANQSTCGCGITCRSRRASRCVQAGRASGRAAGDQVRPRRQPDQAQHERHDDRQLADAQVERRVRDGRADVLVEDARDHAQHVHRGEHDRDHADDRPAPALLEDAGEDQELAGERRRERHGERDHADGHQQRRERRAAASHAAEPGELAGRRAPLDHAGQQEERGREEAVVDDLQDGAVEAEVVVREQAERDQAGLGERRVGHDAAHVGRAEGQQRAVDERDRGQREQDVPPVVRGVGKCGIAMNSSP